MKEELKNENNSSIKIFISILMITILVITVIGFSFAAFLKAQNGIESNVIQTGDISMTYTEDTNGISIENALPMSDAVGKNLNDSNQYFDFTVNYSIAGTTTITYEISAKKDQVSTIPDENVKLYLEEQASGSYVQSVPPTIFTPLTSASDIGTPAGEMLLKTVKRVNSGSDNYRLRMWLKEDAVVDASKYFSIKINVYGKAS